jgi:hypothetical protein
MPVRRPLVALAALVVVPLPACLHISAQPAPAEDPKPAPKATARAADPATTPQPPRLDFASLPRVPGTKMPLRPQPGPGAIANVQKPPPAPLLPATGHGEPGPFPLVAPPAAAPEPPILVAVREYCAGRSDRAIEVIRSLDKPNQDLVLALLPVLARGASADLTNDPATVAALAEQLRSATARLEPRAALQIEKVAFCSDVSGFGRFVPRAPDAPYRPHAQANLYLEVRNLGSAPTNDGFVTHVHAAVEVRDAHQRLVEQIDPDDYRRRVPVVRFERKLPTRSPLHDFHVLYQFSVPPAPGVYTVTVELRDATGRRVAKTAPTQFCVAGH